MEKEQIKFLMDLLGGQTAVSKAIGTNQSTVGSWIQNGRIPAHRAKQIHSIFRKKIKLSDMRPDLWGK